ncbi:MAG: cytochrome c [Pseudomonadota bacterium]|jgi:cytochrome c556|nr:cytochrome c [Pseudomonadota bacterium]
MQIKPIVAAGVLILAATGAHAESGAEQAIHYRQGVYRAMEWNLTRMMAMAQGRKRFDAAEFAARSDRLVLLGGMVGEGFADADSLRGDTVETRASYRILEARERFDRLMAEMQQRTERLRQAVASGQERDDLRRLLGQVAQSCKACHDKFRE